MTYPGPLASVTVEIDSVDVTDRIPAGSLVINYALTSQVDTCTLTIEQSSDIDPQEWQELVVTAGAARLFGGYIVNARRDEGAALDVDYQIDASDYSIRLDKVLVKAEFANKTDAEIIEALFDTYLPGEGYDYTTNVQTIVTYPRIRFNRKTLLECVLQLADLSRADWYVDADKNLLFFERATNTTPAAYAVSDDPDLVTSFPASDMTVERDGIGVANRVEIVGGNFRSDDATFFLAGTGEDERIILPFRFFAPDGETSVLMSRNDGTQAVPVWTPLTVKPGYIGELSSTDDVLYYFNEKVIEQTDNWPELPNAVRINAKYEVPLRARVQDQNSISHYGLILDDVVVDPDIIDKDVARAAGLAKLAENAIAQPVIEFDTLEHGLRDGQIISIKNTQFAIDGNYLIHRVKARFVSGNFIHYQVSAGVYNPDLIDLMLMLARRSKPDVIWRDDEVLDELLQISESLPLSEASATTDSTPPYYFSEIAAEAFDWGFGSFDPTT